MKRIAVYGMVLVFTAACGSSEMPPQPGHTSTNSSTGKVEGAAMPGMVSDKDFKQEFNVDKSTLVPTGRNDYFILEPGYKIVLAAGDGAKAERVEITVLDQTEVVDGVTCRVVEERETVGSALKEISRNFFAIDPKSMDVYYFGEDVDNYKDGKVESHTGAWLSGVDGAKFGLIMPGNAMFGQKYYQEQAPGKAMDRAEHISIGEIIKTPGGEFGMVLRVNETTPLEPDDISVKLYARGVGMIGDGSLRYTKEAK